MLYKILFLVTAFHAVAAVPMLKPDESVDMKLSKLQKRVQALSVDTTGVDAPDETVKAFTKGLFESCTAVREARGCSHPMAAKHCAASCAAAKKLVAGTAVTSANKCGGCDCDRYCLYNHRCRLGRDGD